MSRLYAPEVIHETGNIFFKISVWDEKLSHEREISLFWRSICNSIESPCDGVVADIMKRFRAQYHYVIRNFERNAILLRNTMAESIINNNSRDL